jgi:hypothetical protein
MERWIALGNVSLGGAIRSRSTQRMWKCLPLGRGLCNYVAYEIYLLSEHWL